MEETRIEKKLCVDGYEITASFLKQSDSEVIRHVKGIILASYTEYAINNTANDKLDEPGTPRYCKENA